jgi:hypothetical protein
VPLTGASLLREETADGLDRTLVALAVVEGGLSDRQRDELVPSASDVVKHWPTNVTPDAWRGGSHGFLARLRTLVDHLRDSPRCAAKSTSRTLPTW